MGKFMLFMKMKDIMTRSLFPYCCGNNRGKITLLEACCNCLDAYIGQFIAHNELLDRNKSEIF